MFYFDLPTFAQNLCIKSIYSRDFWCSAKQAVILLLLREGSCFIASFVEHPIYSDFKMYSVLILVVLFWFIDIYPKCVKKKHLFSKFQVLHKGSRDIASFVEHPVSSNFKMYGVPILVFWFQFATINPKCIFDFSWNFRCYAKEAVLLLLSWSTMYVAILKCIVFWF